MRSIDRFEIFGVKKFLSRLSRFFSPLSLHYHASAITLAFGRRTLRLDIGQAIGNSALDVSDEWRR